MRVAGLKWCSKCERWVPLENWYKNRAHEDGLATYCKSCDKAASVERRRKRWGKELRRYYRERYRNGGEHTRAISRRAAATRRARKREQFVEQVDPRLVYLHDGGICGICGDLVEGDFDVDHVIPLAHDGEHSYANARLAHVACNRQRGRAIATANRERRACRGFPVASGGASRTRRY
jgi:5-methylcytosine-specific restriction endonuclease McrA